jgi:hypothetical protein
LDCAQGSRQSLPHDDFVEPGAECGERSGIKRLRGAQRMRNDVFSKKADDVLRGECVRPSLEKEDAI